MPSRFFDPYHQWLGIRSGQHPIHHYRLLGLDVFESDREVIASAADRQMAHIRSFQNGQHSEASQRLLDEIAKARLCLMNAEAKEEYDDELSRVLLLSGDGPSADGAAFGEYLLLDQLAVASASTVYKAKHRTMQRTVALQTLTRAAAATPHEVKRFRRKAALLARLEHPQLIGAYDAGIRDGVHCLVMELVEGASLHRHLQLAAAGSSEGRPSPREIVQWVKLAAAGLAHGHSQGVVHRRVAPSNLLLDAKHGVKVAGFGLALQQTADGVDLPEQPGTPIGNVDTIAPEQIQNSQDVGPPSDVYGLGCTLCALLIGKPPFSGSRDDKVTQHLQAAPPRLAGVFPGIDPTLQEIVHRMMAKTPEDRPATMYQVIQELQAWLLSAPSTNEAPVVVVKVDG